MGVCLYQKSVCKVYRTEGVYCRYIYVHTNLGICTVVIVNCLLKNKFNMHVKTLYAKFSCKEYNLIKVYINYSLFKFNYN